MRLALRLLLEIRMQGTKPGETAPFIVSLTKEADALLDAWMIEHDASEDNDLDGHLGGAHGKGLGQVLRLALVLEHLWWAAPGRSATEGKTVLEQLNDPALQPPHEVSVKAVTAAIELMDKFFWPMAVRVHGGSGGYSVAEQNAHRIARRLCDTRPLEVNAREVRHSMKIAAMKEAHQVTAALQVLEEAGWLARKPAEADPGRGRPRQDYFCNLEAIKKHFPEKPIPHEDIQKISKPIPEISVIAAK